MSDITRKILCEILFLITFPTETLESFDYCHLLSKYLKEVPNKDVKKFNFLQILLNAERLVSAVSVAYDDIVFDLSNKENGDDNNYIYF